MATASNFERIEQIALGLPESTRVNVEAWDNLPTFRVAKKNYVFVELSDNESEDRWEEITEWIRTSYTLVAPKRLAQIVMEQDFGPDTTP